MNKINIDVNSKFLEFILDTNNFVGVCSRGREAVYAQFCKENGISRATLMRRLSYDNRKLVPNISGHNRKKFDKDEIKAAVKEIGNKKTVAKLMGCALCTVYKMIKED